MSFKYLNSIYKKNNFLTPNKNNKCSKNIIILKEEERFEGDFLNNKNSSIVHEIFLNLGKTILIHDNLTYEYIEI